MASGFVNLLDSSQVTALIVAYLAQTASIEDLTGSTLIVEGALGTFNSYPLFVAPFACKLVQLSLVQWDGSDIPASDTNYWGIAVLRYRAKVSQGSVVSKTTQTTGQAWPARTDWNFDNSAFSPTAQLFAKGDIATISTTNTGTPVAASRVLASWRIEPV